jgi:hypothetical protein
MRREDEMKRLWIGGEWRGEAENREYMRRREGKSEE